MPVEFSPAVTRPRFPTISWPAIFAALAVGIAVQLLLTLAGFALGVHALDTGDEPAETVTLAAASWAAMSMLVASLIGGYVAGRCSGLRRTGDGVLHGMVAWAVTTLFYAALATTAVGTLTTGLFGLLGSTMNGNAAAQASVGAAGDRERAMDTLTGIGLTREQASSVLDQVASPGGAPPASASPGAAGEAADAVGSGTLWLAATVLLSLLLGILGGMMGVRGSRRIVRRVDRDALAPQPRILSRT